MFYPPSSPKRGLAHAQPTSAKWRGGYLSAVVPLLSCPRRISQQSSKGASCLASAPGIQSPSCAGAIFKPAQMSSCCRQIFYHQDLCTLNPIQFPASFQPVPTTPCSEQGLLSHPPHHTCFVSSSWQISSFYLATCLASFRTRQNVCDWKACVPAHVLPTQAPCFGVSCLHLHGQV